MKCALRVMNSPGWMYSDVCNKNCVISRRYHRWMLFLSRLLSHCHGCRWIAWSWNLLAAIHLHAVVMTIISRNEYFWVHQWATKSSAHSTTHQRDANNATVSRNAICLNSSIAYTFCLWLRFESLLIHFHRFIFCVQSPSKMHVADHY